jgi:hypothetical protein
LQEGLQGTLELSVLVQTGPIPTAIKVIEHVGHFEAAVALAAVIAVFKSAEHPS